MTPIVAAALLLAVAAVANPWTLAPLANPSGLGETRVLRLALHASAAVAVAAAAALVVLRHRRWAPPLAANLVVLIVTLGALVAVLELSFPRLIGRLPLTLQAYVPKPFDVLAQSSKRGTVPVRYVALLGDSYARGFGDWLLEVDHWANPPFHSAHLLRDRLGVDVVALGRSGASSITSLVVAPTTALARLGTGVALEPPRLLVAYVYEGNDLTDNLRELTVRGYHRARGALTSEGFAAFVASRIAPAQGDRRLGELLGARFALNLARNAIDRARGRSLPDAPRLHHWAPEPGVNLAWSGGLRHLPAFLQGPALELTERELEEALAVLDLSVGLVARWIPDVPLVLVYLPSVLSVYALASDASAQTVDRRPAVHPAAAVTQRSDVIAGRVARIAQARGVGFVDTRPRLRAAAAEAPVHGPRDWRHFNRRGYEALADAVASHLVCAQRNRTGECVAWRLTPAARLEASPCVASRAG